MKERLLRFFEAKNQKYVVLAVADLLKMEGDDRRNLIACLFNYGWTKLQIKDDKRYFLQYAFDGYLKIEIRQLFEKLDLNRLEQFQQIICNYHNIRFGRNDLVVEQVCDCVKGQKAKPGCNCCDGEGIIKTWMEISEAEQIMSEGKSLLKEVQKVVPTKAED